MTLFLLGLLLFPSTNANAALECEHPLHQRLADTIPVFKKGYDPKKVLTMYRGVQAPQLDDAGVLRLLFQDPWTYSASKMIESGASLDMTNGSWKDSGNQGTNEKAFLERWDEAVEKTSLKVETAKEDGHPVWNPLSSLSSYDSRPYYDWVQFISPLYDTAAGYGQFVMNLEVPDARTHPGTSSWETVVPVLLAPWETTAVTFHAYRKAKLKKLFYSDGAEENRCVISGLEFTDVQGPTTYLRLCEDGEKCPQDTSLLPRELSHLGPIILQQQILGRQIGITREKPESIVSCEKRYPAKTQAEFDALVAQWSPEQRDRKFRSLIHLRTSTTPMAVRCRAENTRNLDYWKNLGSSTLTEKMLLGRALGSSKLMVDAIIAFSEKETGYDTLEYRLENFAVEETTETRRAFISGVVSALKKAPPNVPVSTLIGRLEAYLAGR